MELDKVLDELYERRDCIDVAIEALEWGEKRARGVLTRPPEWLKKRKDDGQRSESAATA